MDKINIIYIGNSKNMLEYLLNTAMFSVKGVVCEKKKSDTQLARLAQENGIELELADGKQMLIDILEKWKISIAVMYEFGIIIPDKVIEYMDIFNFHPGSLKENRGSSPVYWSVLLGKKETEMSLYKISKEIDLGEVVTIGKYQIDRRMTPGELKKELEKKIPDMLILLEVFIRKKRKGIVINEGIYRQRLKEEDYTIEKNDSEFKIDCKIRSQGEHRGAIFMLNGKKFYVKSLEEYYDLRNI